MPAVRTHPAAQLVEEPEYYLWSAELEILSTYAPEIALRAFGHATSGTSKLCSRYTQPKGLAAAASQPLQDEPQYEQERNGRKNGYPLPLDRAKEKWGDQRVGKHNGGVNGEEGLDGKRTVGCASLVELGAGSLRKVSILPPWHTHSALTHSLCRRHISCVRCSTCLRVPRPASRRCSTMRSTWTARSSCARSRTCTARRRQPTALTRRSGLCVAARSASTACTRRTTKVRGPRASAAARG